MQLIVDTQYCDSARKPLGTKVDQEDTDDENNLNEDDCLNKNNNKIKNGIKENKINNREYLPKYLGKSQG